jgi:hypothetical protein
MTGKSVRLQSLKGGVTNIYSGAAADVAGSVRKLWIWEGLGSGRTQKAISGGKSRERSEGVSGKAARNKLSVDEDMSLGPE